jgi:hypothetical protein
MWVYAYVFVEKWEGWGMDEGGDEGVGVYVEAEPKWQFSSTTLAWKGEIEPYKKNEKI